MTDRVQTHYSLDSSLADSIARRLQDAGKNLRELTTLDLAPVDEFHIRGRQATLELGREMGLNRNTNLLDIGSGLGGPARTLAEVYGCRVIGVDLTEAFCIAAGILSEWVNLRGNVTFQQGDATDLPFADNQFDAAMTIHVAMNIPDKRTMYSEARRVIKPKGVFAVYDVLKGEGGDVLFPVPWDREPSLSHLVTREEMVSLLREAGFEIVKTEDSTQAGHAWFKSMMKRMREGGPPVISFQTFMGEDFPEMVENQERNLSERRIRTVSFICRS